MTDFIIKKKDQYRKQNVRWRDGAPAITEIRDVAQNDAEAQVVQLDSHIGPTTDFNPRREFRVDPIEIDSLEGRRRVTRDAIGWHLMIAKDAAKAFSSLKVMAAHLDSPDDDGNYEIVFNDGKRSGVKISPQMAKILNVAIPEKSRIITSW